MLALKGETVEYSKVVLSGGVSKAGAGCSASFRSGWFFEVQKSYRPNASIARDGRLIVD